LFTVFGDGSPSDIDSFRSKEADQIGIAKWFRTVFSSYDTADSLADSFGAHVLSTA
jgi:hypothetical protein